MHVKRKTYLTVAAVFAFMFLLLLSFIPGGKASAATKTYSVACTGGKVSYYNSNVSYFSNDSRVSIYCSNKGSFTITVEPNTSTSSRTITLYSKKGNGTTVDTLRISQPGIATKTINVGCTGGNYSHGIPGANSISSTNTAICSSLASNKNYLVIKPNTSCNSRSCTVTVKNSAGRIIGRVTINQSGVPTKTINAACTGGNYAHGFSGASTVSSTNTAICNRLAPNKNYLVVNPNTSTSARNCTVTVKNSAGRIIGYVKINQSGVPTKTINAACTGGNYTHGISGASTVSSTNTAICNSLTSNKNYLVVNPNTSTSARNCTVTVKNSAGRVIAYVYIKQSGVPVKTVSVSGGYTSFSYYKSGATNFSYTSSQIYKVTCSNPGSYTLYVTANPNASASRTFNVIAKNSSGAYLEIIKVTQAKTAYSTVTSNYNSDPRTITLSAANADYSKTVISNTSMCTKGSTSTQFKLTQNSSLSSRSCTVTFKDKYGAIVKKCVLNQSGVPTQTINAACIGGEYSYTKSGAFNYTYSNTNVCSSRRNNCFVVKPNTTTSARNCTVTVKNSSGKVIAYVYIKQAAVPVKKVSASGDSGAKFYYGNSNVASFTYSSSYVSSISASNPGSFTIYLKENPSPSKTRTFDIIAKNSKGAYVEIIRVTQAKHTVTSKTLNVACTGGNVYYANSIASTYTYSNTSICNSRSGNYFVVKPNSSTAARTCTVTVKNSAGEVVGYVYIKQSGVPVKYVTVSGNSSAKLSYGNSKASYFSYSSTYVSKITASNPGSFTIYFYANPSTKNVRIFDITAKNSKGASVEIIRVTQQKFTPLTISKSVDSKRNTFTYINSDAAKFTYSVSSMFGGYKSLGSGKYQFVVNANKSTSSRTGIILVYDKKGTVIEKISVKQSAVVTYTVGSGTGENITYTNANAATFNLPINIKSVRKVSTGKYAFTQTVNLGKDKLTGVISVLDKNGNVIQYLRVFSTPVVMNIKGNFDEKIPNIGKTYTGTFETSNPVKITLTNATFKDGKSTMTISKNALNANGSFSTPFEINVKSWSGTADRKVTIKVTSVSNGLTLNTMTLTQLGQQIGFRGATAEYPLGSLGRDHYVYKIATSVGSDWTKIDYVPLKDTGFDLLAAICTELNDECVCLLDHAVVNAQKVIYNGVDNCYIYATFYKDSSDNRYVIITGNDSSTDRGFDNFPAEGIYGSDKSFKEVKSNGDVWSGYIDVAHATNANYIIWVDESGTLKMNLRKFGKDSVKLNGVEVFFKIGYKYPSNGGTTIQQAHYVMSPSLDVPSRYKTLLNKLCK